ncbi:MAG: thioredoxin family protein [Planctomycetes bacterium]|nr:thioredoxin family protein [Planctomycetota bacterium]
MKEMTMRECVLMGCLLATGILTVDVAMAEPTSDRWYHSYSQAFYNAKRLDKPLVVHFYADWCGPCRQMESAVLNTSEVTAKLGRTIIGVKINVDRNPELVEGFHIDTFPSDVFVAPSGKILSRNGGYSDRESYLRQIAQAVISAADQPAIKRGNAPRDTNVSPALQGYSPVTITGDKKWLKGDREFAWE